MPNFSTYQTLCVDLQYSQFPLDHSVEIIKNNACHCQSECKLAIYRQEQQMYYQFVWKIAEEQYVGAVVVLSNRCFFEFERLILAFLHTLKSAATENYLSHTDCCTQIIANELNEAIVKIDEFETILAESLPEIKLLPLLQLENDINTCKMFNINTLESYENIKDRIFDSSISQGFTIINFSNIKIISEEFEITLLPHNEFNTINEEKLTPIQIYKYAEFRGQNGIEALKKKIAQLEAKIHEYEDKCLIFAGYTTIQYQFLIDKCKKEIYSLQSEINKQEELRVLFTRNYNQREKKELVKSTKSGKEIFKTFRLILAVASFIAWLLFLCLSQ